MLVGYTTQVAAYSPLMKLLDGFLLSSNEVADHFRFGHDYMSALRKAGKGPPWLALPTGAIRYSSAEVANWQTGAERGPLTLDRVSLAVAACAAVPIEHRAAIVAHLEQSFSQTGT